MSQEIGQMIAGRYRLESVLGTGGVGTVFRATQEPLMRPVAVKMLRPELSEDPAVRRRFVREARAVAALAHQNIAVVHDFGVAEDDSLYLVMEYFEGESLAHALEKITEFRTIVALFDQVLAGLAHAHARGVVHRDIKPANVLVSTGNEPEPVVKIVDFGIATVNGFEWSDPTHVTGSGRVVGTPHYMSPEQARGERRLGPASDVYSVGVLIYWALSGSYPFDGPTPMDIMVAHCSQPVPRLVPLRHLDVPAGVDALLADALRKVAARRIPSAAELRRRLRALVEDDAPTATFEIGGTTSTQPGLTRSARESTTLVEQDPVTMEETQPETDAVPSTALAVDETTAELLSSAAWRRGPSISGRGEEQRSLLDAAERVAEDAQGVVFTIEGEAGLGKSKLAAWFKERLVEEGRFRCAVGTFHREGERGLRGVREAFDLLLETRGLDVDQVGGKVAQRLTRWGITDPRDARRLVAFLRPSLLDSGRAADGDVALDSLFALLLRVALAIAEDKPLLIWLDDVHWSGPETAAFIEFVAAELPRRPAALMLLVTLQIEDIADDFIEAMLGRISRHQGSSVQRRRLQKIDAEAAATLVREVLPASDELCRSLVERGGGNPMHLLHLTRFLLEERLVERRVDGWHALPEVDVAELLPPSLADMIELRFDQVERRREDGDRLRDLVDRAAILGMRFRFAILEAALRREGRSDLITHLDEDVDTLLDEQLLRMTESREDDILAFPTGLVRDVVLRRMKHRRAARRLHRYAAEAKLEVMGHRTEKIAGELAEHFRRARDPQRELHYSLIAADVAERSHRPNDAFRHLIRAIELVEARLVPEDEEAAAGSRTPAVSALHLRAGEMAMGLGDYDAAKRSFAACRSAAGPTDPDRVSAIYGLADVDWMRGAFEDALVRYQEGLAAADPLDRPELTVRGLLGVARMRWHQGGGDDAEQTARAALDAANESGSARQEAEALWLLGDLARARGDVSDADALFRSALERFETLRHDRGIAKCLAKMAVTARMRNDLDRATSNYEAALAIYTRLGARRGVAHQLNGLGDVARFRDDLATAADYYRRAVELFQTIGVPFDAAIGLTNLGIVARDNGDLDLARDAFSQAIDVSERVGYPYLILGARLNSAFAAILRGERDEAIAELSTSLELLDEVDLVDPDYAAPLEGIARSFAATGDDDRARELFGRAEALWRELGRTDDAERVARSRTLLDSSDEA